MDGEPVWLASVSLRRKGGEIIPTPLWRPWMHERATGVIDALLGDVGDTRERQFRMNLTVCRHRALSHAEQQRIGWPDRCGRAVHLAGGPLEIIWERGCVGALSTKPCASAERMYLDQADIGHEIDTGKQTWRWIPADCGECPPCRARAA